MLSWFVVFSSLCSSAHTRSLERTNRGATAVIKPALPRVSTYESIVGDQTEGLLLGLAVDGAEGRGQSTGGQAVDIRLFLTLL
jgi:hypothetical protein